MRFLLLWLCAVCCNAQALTLRLCTFDRALYPYTMPDGSGLAQQLLRRTGKGLQIDVNNMIAPRARCLALLQSGEVDALVAAFLPERMEYGAYPMTGEQPDARTALAVVRFMVYRRRGSNIGWDGQHFSNLGQQPVGVPLGFIHEAMLRKLGAVIDGGGLGSEQNFDKLAQNRLAAVVALEEEGKPLIELKYREQIEALPFPLHQTPLYLLVNRMYYIANKQKIELYWSALRQRREAPDYRQGMLPLK
ncbi:hypothetical protein HSX11_11085 [Oxalobacteraceae bacterium]|nr:hypothetical protein [Oxalobacteraceae bacterium]